VVIDVEDLDLAGPGIASRVYARIASTAARLCRDASAPWDGSRYSAIRRCISATIDAAVKQANAPTLTAVHESATGHRSEFTALIQ
jgi:UrcA family protein